MYSCEHLNHPFQQDAGTSQDERMPDQLGEGSAPIDGRQVSDLLNYFAGLAGQIKFYRDDGSTSDWRPFFQNSLPFQLSKIDTYVGDNIKSGMESAVRLFLRGPSANGLQLLILQTYYMAIYPMQQWSTLLAGTGLDLEAQLNTLIRDRLLTPLQTFIKWLNTAVHCWGIQAPDLSVLSANPVWGLTPAMLSAYETGFSCTIPSTRSQLLVVQEALTEIVNAFADVVDNASNGVADLVNDDLYSLLQNNGQADTPPHLAVLYSFLNQYLYVMDDLNGLTQEQLNFFFQQVLTLAPGAAIADEAYIVFSIQKQLSSYTVEAQTSLKAGKDNNGADIYFELNDDVTLNQAQVAAVQTVFVNKQPWGQNSFVEGVYAAPNAQMADGVSKPFTDPAAAWPSLGAKVSLYTPPGATAPIDYPNARLGFILASKVLYLQEGKRKIDIQLACQWNQGQGACNDGVTFKDVFRLARESVCAQFVVITPDILSQALQAGVSQATIAAMQQKYLLDDCQKSPCAGAPPVYKNEYLLWIPCCTCGKKKASFVEEDPCMKARQELDGTSYEYLLNLCPDEWIEEYCELSAAAALTNELNTIDNITPEEVTILEELLVLQRLFDVQLSGAKGWQAPDYLDMELVEMPASGTGATTTGNNFIWHIRATIDAGSPGIGFYDATKMGENFQVSDPLMKIELNPAITWEVKQKAAATGSCMEVQEVICGQQVSPYEFFRNVTLLTEVGEKDIPTKIDVTVCGVKTLVVQNDANLMDVTKAFTPFGPKPLIPDFTPIQGATASSSTGTVPGPNFYIGSTEVLLKAWTEINVNMNWLSKPGNFNDYYSGYFTSGALDLDGNYEVEMALLEDGNWYDRQGTHHLFPNTSGSFPTCCHNQYAYSFHMRPHDFHSEPMDYDPTFAPITKWVAGMSRGFLRMTLINQDFLHKYYSWVMGQAMSNPGAYTNVVNEPWTPTIQPGMSIDYKATAEVDDITLVQLYPFEGTSMVMNIYGTPTLMANFCNEGNLYIGFSGLVPGQGLNVLFQLAEATASSQSTADTVNWQYLANNEWKDLRNGIELVTDGTSGLTRTGIIQFAFPDDISNANTILPAGNYWITAWMGNYTQAVGRTVAILTQAGLATYAAVVNVNDPQRSATPLPAGSISKLTVADANIIKINQPYPSFGGSAPEASGTAYAVRVSEQLRHKGRAIQKWDYERLVLRQFPELSRVKCINHSYYLDSSSYKYDFPMSPGNILVAVLPDTNQLAVSDELQPTVPTSMLTAIQTFLTGVQSPFVKVAVANPRYEPVMICVSVVLQGDGTAPPNVPVCQAQLQQTLQAFLAPWLGGNMDAFQFAQPLYLSDVANLIESQDCVSYLSDLRMGHEDDDLTGTQADHVAPRTPRSILVAGTIVINPVTPVPASGSPILYIKKVKK